MEERGEKKLERFLERADAILEGAEKADSEPTEPGTRIGGYRLLRRLGHGGMGVVWLAEDEALGRNVALKLLAPHMTVEPEAIWRFGQEASAAARLAHPNIVAIHTAGEEDGTRYLVMDYVEGVGLDRLLDLVRGRRPESVTCSEIRGVLAAETGGSAPEIGNETFRRLAVEWVMQAAKALHHAHTRGVLHRDVKPSNLLVDREGSVRIVDFGLARIEESAPVTRTGAVLGTLTYMAPEALEGKQGKIDARADVYSLGAVLFELLAFRPPFTAASLSDLVEDVSRGGVPRLRNLHRGLPRDLELVATKCLSKRREHRYATADDLAEDLRRFLAGDPVRARPPGPVRRLTHWTRRHPAWAAAVLAVLVLSASGWIGQDIAARSRAAAEARGLRDLAAIKMREFREVEQRLGEADEDKSRRRGHLGRRFDLRERYAPLAEVDRRMHALAILLGRTLEEAHAALARAERIERRYGDVSQETRDAFARYYEFRYDVARERGDTVQAALWREKLVRAGGELERRAEVYVSARPAGAKVYLFRYESYETVRTDPPVVPRLVPVPTSGFGRCREGAWFADFHPGDACLVVRSVTRDSPAVQMGVTPGDLILAIQGRSGGDGVFAAKVIPGGAASRGGVRPWDHVGSVQNKTIRTTWDWRHFPQGSSSTRRELQVGSTRLYAQGGVPLSEATGMEVIGPAELMGVPAPRDGGRLTVLHEGEPLELVVPEGRLSGIAAEITAYPLIVSPQNRIATESKVDVAAGSYLLLARAPGHEDLRYPFVAPRDARIELALLRAGETPEGFVWVPPGKTITGADPERVPRALGHLPPKGSIVHVPGFFVGRMEVTTRKYFEFVNDPETLTKIEAARAEGRTLYLPRHYNLDGPMAKRSKDSKWVPEKDPDSPILGISNRDVRGFLAWHCRRARAKGERWLWALPSVEQWERAARGADGRLFPWGNRFCVDLCLNQESRLDWMSGVAGGFEPRDASPFGVFDMAGSRREFVGRTGTLKGGSWGDGQESYFRASWVEGLGKGYYNWTTGFRPVLERNPDAR